MFHLDHKYYSNQMNQSNQFITNHLTISNFSGIIIILKINNKVWILLSSTLMIVMIANKIGNLSYQKSIIYKKLYIFIKIIQNKSYVVFVYAIFRRNSS